MVKSRVEIGKKTKHVRHSMFEAVTIGANHICYLRPLWTRGSPHRDKQFWNPVQRFYTGDVIFHNVQLNIFSSSDMQPREEDVLFQVEFTFLEMSVCSNHQLLVVGTDGLERVIELHFWWCVGPKIWPSHSNHLRPDAAGKDFLIPSYRMLNKNDFSWHWPNVILFMNFCHYGS